MNIENFPTSESAKRMMGYVTGNEFYGKSYVGKWIFQIIGKEMDDAHLRIEEELPYQAFPETATWGLRYHEEKYGLPVRENLSYEERRKLILEKRDTRAPMNPYMMEQILENITGRKAHVNDENTPINTFTVELESGDNMVDVSAAIKKLKEIKQSHVAFMFSFTSLAKIEICGKTEGWKNQYTQCGTVPMVSTGLQTSEDGVQIFPSTAGYKSVSPMAGNSGEAGQYPKTSTGVKITDGAVDIEENTESYLVNYPETSENMETGMYPAIQKRAVYSETETQIEANGEKHKFQSKLSGTEPVVSIRMKEATADTEILSETKAAKVVYEMTGNAETGTRPGISTRVSEDEKGLTPEVTTESYQVRYRLCGDAFEI